jgi:hypothetical protein
MRKPLAALTAAICLSFAAAGTASAAPTWAPAATAPIHPGVQTETDGGQCTANFIYFDGADDVYIGQAAHCAGTDGNTATNGCDAGTLPVGTPVTVDGASKPGTLAYSSWATMQANGETDPDTCQYNDIGLVKLDPADAAKVNPSIPFWGGPTGLTDTTVQGDTVLSYGNSSLRAGITQLSPKQGVSLGQSGGGWTHQVYTVTPGIPGDSGSAFVDAEGKAFGVLSTLQLAPLPAANGVSDLSRMLDYMRTHGGPDVTLAEGTEPFSGPLL